MKALLYTDIKNMRWQNVDDCKTDNISLVCASPLIMVKTKAVGICGSDIHAWQGHDDRRAPPLILGHEAAGIAQNGIHQGKAVAVNPLLVCGSCCYCNNNMDNLCPQRQIISMPPLAGAFAEYFVIAEQNLTPLPDDFDIRHGALIEPLACSWNSVKKGLSALHFPIQNIKAAVIGAGGIGYGCALCLEVFGCNDITIAEINPVRRKTVQKLNRYDVFNPQSQADDHHEKYHIVIDAYGGIPSRELACRLLQPAGVIVHIGLAHREKGLDIRKMTLQEMRFIGVYTYTKNDFKETANALFEGKFGNINWCDYAKMANGAEIFDDILAAKIAVPKIILTV